MKVSESNIVIEEIESDCQIERWLLLKKLNDGGPMSKCSTECAQQNKTISHSSINHSSISHSCRGRPPRNARNVSM